MSCSAWLDARQLLPVTDELARKRDGHARPVAMIPQGKPRKRRDLVSKRQCSRKAERIVWAGSPRWVRHGNLRRRGCQAAEPQLAAILRQHQPKRRSEAAIAGVRQPKRLGNLLEVWASWHSEPKRQPKRQPTRARARARRKDRRRRRVGATGDRRRYSKEFRKHLINPFTTLNYFRVFFVLFRPRQGCNSPLH